MSATSAGLDSPPIDRDILRRLGTLGPWYFFITSNGCIKMPPNSAYAEHNCRSWESRNIQILYASFNKQRSKEWHLRKWCWEAVEMLLGWNFDVDDNHRPDEYVHHFTRGKSSGTSQSFIRRSFRYNWIESYVTVSTFSVAQSRYTQILTLPCKSYWMRIGLPSTQYYAQKLHLVFLYWARRL